jgi:DNA-binding GntR family transcriptional regulator
VVSSAIMGGNLRPGQRISPEALARELGISHIPVREALKVLEGEGLLTRMPRRGFFVSTFSKQEMDDVYLWRQVLEDEALRLAIPLLDEDDLGDMRAIHTEMDRAIRRKDVPAFIATNKRFHLIVSDKLNSNVLDRFLAYLWDAATRYYSGQLGSGIDLSVLQHQHDEFIAACAAKDVDRALAITKAHRGVTLRALSGVMEETVDESTLEAWPAGGRV